MIKALLLLFEPAVAWERIARAQRKLGFILGVFLMPLLLITSAVECYSLMHWGRSREFMQEPRRYSAGEAVIFEALLLALTLICIFGSAKIIKTLGETFHGRNSFTQAFTVAAYGLSPLFTLRLLDAVPGMNLWIGWAMGIVLSIAVLYQGIPRVMLPDPPHAFGLYMMSSIMLALTTGMLRLVIYLYLEGKFKPLESFISKLAARLPF